MRKPGDEKGKADGRKSSIKLLPVYTSFSLSHNKQKSQQLTLVCLQSFHDYPIIVR